MNRKGLDPPGDENLQLANGRRKGQATPVFLPGEFHGQRILVDSSPWDHKELNMTL